MVSRADIFVALLNGTEPSFFSTDIHGNQNITHGPYQSPQLFIPNLDPRISNIWTQLYNFCNLTNLAFQSDRKVPFEYFEELLIFSEYHLLHLSFSGENNSMETIRLAMLAFSVTLFLQAPGTRVRFDLLSRDVQQSIVGPTSFHEMPCEVQLWVLFVAAISAVTDEDDHWIIPLLKSTMRARGITTWNEVKEVIKKFLWIGVLFDNDGERVFEKL
jgi:hypothetical protein